MMIGIMPHDGNKNVKLYKFSGRMKNSWVRIRCKDFIKYLSSLAGKNFSPVIRYVAKHNEEDNLLYISILDNNGKS